MKKLLFPVLACALLLAGCGGNDPISNPVAPPATTPVTPPVSTPAPSATSPAASVTAPGTSAAGADSVASATSEPKSLTGMVVSAMVNVLDVELDSGEMVTFTLQDATIEPDGAIIASGDMVTVYYYGEMNDADISQEVEVVRVVLGTPAT